MNSKYYAQLKADNQDQQAERRIERTRVYERNARRINRQRTQTATERAGSNLAQTKLFGALLIIGMVIGIILA